MILRRKIRAQLKLSIDVIVRVFLGIVFYNRIDFNRNILDFNRNGCLN
jgi:hypothetical protein